MCSLPASKSPLRPRLCLPLAAYSTLSRRLQHASGISLVDDARAPLSENAHGGGALVTVRAAEDDGTYVEQVSPTHSTPSMPTAAPTEDALRLASAAHLMRALSCGGLSPQPILMGSSLPTFSEDSPVCSRYPPFGP
ncbi:hypothetical protein K466DRAFT_407753 [Polyporus arcularius HHB13444]|uniref:Uncharacterized protein n=1 Tax=Polyporus arcularius HHB13444 TaxID=1314778 RepID=A0A5C3P282_9APHY|nr:hypothetical protein K466DRAFT_407753 [Polyporus arcularius HHB13444]